uniref:Uncharacterized protein n=1 Tax=mine drainage metagenome TaxID=410659 RepID=E6PYX2_9ZZZZ
MVNRCGDLWLDSCLRQRRQNTIDVDDLGYFSNSNWLSLNTDLRCWSGVLLFATRKQHSLSKKNRCKRNETKR